MNHLSRLCAAVALLVVFTLPAIAGDMGCPITTPPPQPQTAGEMDHPVTATDEATSDGATAVDLWTGVAFTLMRSAFSVF